MTDAHFTIWGRPNSHNVKKVAWFAVELGLNFARRDMGGSFGYTDEYLAINPNRLVPTISDGKVNLWESNAIVRYMAGEYGGEKWFPADPIDRAMADRWMDWQFGYADAQRRPFLSFARTKPEDRDMDTVAQDMELCARHLAVIEAQLGESDWLSGGQFGIGDIPMGVYIHTWFALPFAKPEFPRIAEWYSRLQTRPGYGEHVMIPLT